MSRWQIIKPTKNRLTGEASSTVLALPKSMLKSCSSPTMTPGSLYNTLCQDKQIENFNQRKNQYFANLSAYGTPTKHSVSNAQAYFDGEADWHACFEDKPSDWKMSF